MLTHLSRCCLFLLPCLLMFVLPVYGNAPRSLSDFDQKAREGKPVDVVFLGGSLTWGANASDPQTTSYRGRMMQYLVERYPETPIRFHDAAIGGSGSTLGIFRLERDVLRHNPDLVFLDFTANDGIEGKDVETLATYERIVRELLSSGSAVMPVLLGFKAHIANVDGPLPARHQSHMELLDAYELPSAKVVAEMRSMVKEGKVDPDAIYYIGTDTTHPGDEGYQIFADIVQAAFEDGVGSGQKAVLPPEPFFEDKYPNIQRQVLVERELPEGWTRQPAYRTALWFDGLPSRWMGDVAVATADSNPEPLEIPFHGSMVGIFGERNGFTAPVRFWIDGEPVPAPGRDGGDIWNLDTSRFAPPHKGSGNLFLWVRIANDLPDGEHTLRIEPVFDEAGPESDFRIESVCSAGR